MTYPKGHGVYALHGCLNAIALYHDLGLCFVGSDLRQSPVIGIGIIVMIGYAFARVGCAGMLVCAYASRVVCACRNVDAYGPSHF